jgi:hypothetical protein
MNITQELTDSELYDHIDSFHFPLLIGKKECWDQLQNNFTNSQILLKERQQDVLNLRNNPEVLNKIYNELTEEIAIFRKANSSLEIIFSVNKEKEPILFSVRLVATTLNELEKEEFLEVFELFELAMSKYKKTDKTISSVFQPA